MRSRPGRGRRRPVRGSASRAARLLPCACGPAAGRRPAPCAASQAAPPLASQPSSCAAVSSGWNCTASERPSTNACEARGVRASSRARGGRRPTVLVPLEPGPGGHERGVVGLDARASRSRARATRSTDPPSAAASSCPPKQIPSTGTPPACARRSIASSAATQAAMPSSVTDHGAPIGTTASYAQRVGEVDVDAGGVEARGGHDEELLDVVPALGERLAHRPRRRDVVLLDDEHSQPSAQLTRSLHGVLVLVLAADGAHDGHRRRARRTAAARAPSRWC